MRGCDPQLDQWDERTGVLSTARSATMKAADRISAGTHKLVENETVAVAVERVSTGMQVGL